MVVSIILCEIKQMMSSRKYETVGISDRPAHTRGTAITFIILALKTVYRYGERSEGLSEGLSTG